MQWRLCLSFYVGKDLNLWQACPALKMRTSVVLIPAEKDSYYRYVPPTVPMSESLEFRIQTAKSCPKNGTGKKHKSNTFPQ